MAINKELKPQDLNFMPSGNRTIKPFVVAKLKRSIKDYGVIRSVVVVRVNLFGDGNKYYIADGQHLFLACEALNMLSQLPIIVVNKKFDNIHELVEFIAVLNTTQSPWKLSDFVEAYASTHTYFSYNKLKAKKMEYSLPYALLAVIYMGTGRKQAADAVKNGNFRVVNEPKSDLIAGYITDLIPLFGRTNSTALSNLAYVMYEWIDASNYNHIKFKKYITLNLAAFSLATATEMKSLIVNYDNKH